MVDNLSLAGKVAIVTGSGRENGIGAGIAFALARNGAAVTINFVSDSSAPRAEAIAKKIQREGGRATVVRASVDQEGSRRLVQETLKAFKTDHVDILVNNAVSAYFISSLDTTKEQAESTFQVNVLGALYMVQAVVPHMPRGGRIINISTVASKIGPDILSVYGASKAALDSLTYSWAGELGRSKGITVNSIAPGPVPTEALPSDQTESNAVTDPLVALTRAEDRMGTTADIADGVLLIASEKSRWITGQYISVSGGITGV